MEMRVLPECYFDTVLVKNILKIKRVNHQKSCYKVESSIKEIDDFAVGVIDKDKVTIGYLKDCKLEIEHKNLLLWKHKTKKHYIVQLVPGLERWVLNVIEEGNVEIEDLNLPTDLEGLKEYTKYRFVSENEELKKLCKRLVSSDSETMSTLSNWLNYLFEHNRNADINTLKNV